MLGFFLRGLLFLAQLAATGLLIAAVQIGGLVAIAELLVIIAAEVVAAVSSLFFIRVKTGLNNLREELASDKELSADAKGDEEGSAVRKSESDSGRERSASGKELRQELHARHSFSSGKQRSASGKWPSAREKEMSACRKEFAEGLKLAAIKNSCNEFSASGEDLSSVKETDSDKHLSTRTEFTCEKELSAGQESVFGKVLSAGAESVCGNELSAGQESVCRKELSTGAESLCGKELSAGADLICRKELFAGQKKYKTDNLGLVVVGRHKWAQSCPSSLEVLDDV